MRKFSVICFLAALLLITACSSPLDNTANAPEIAVPPAGPTAQLKKLPGIPAFNVDKIQSVSAPFATPGVRIAMSVKDRLSVAGWAIDKPSGKAASGVDIAIDGTPFAAGYGNERPEIVAFFKTPDFLKCGFAFQFPAKHLAVGDHAVTVRVIASDASGYFESPPLAVHCQ
jgi:hypothetical protein